MSESRNNFFTDLWRELRDVWRALDNGWARTGVRVRNRLRAMRRMRLDYVVLPVGGALPERAAPPRSFLERQLPLPSPPLSMEQLNGRLRMIADADNVRGVVFIFRGFTVGLATLQNFRRAVQRLRAAGKECIVYTPYLDLAHYYAAAAADRIIVPPQTRFDVLGLRSEVVFLKDALAQLGVEVDVVQISPYKTAFDPLAKAELTPEYRAQLEWLLDDQYDMITADLAGDRGLTQAEMQQLIDGAPYFAADALAKGLVDHVAYDDELATLLGKEKAAAPEETEDEDEKRPAPRARLRLWEKARPMLMEKWRPRTDRFIGVVSLEGAIMMGPSRQPPIELPIPILGGAVAGEETLARLLRKAQGLDNMAALIFYVDSGGGSSLASDLIAREVSRLCQKKPVLVYMGNVAASGGYYVAAPAQRIVSQRGTLTGSIGVITARPSTSELYRKLDVNRVSLKRGEHADLYTDLAPMSGEEREIFWQGIVETYEQFKAFVADGRPLEMDELDPICEGRVWTGRQALERRLVDDHGDFVDAVRAAAELAGLPADEEHVVRTANLYARSSSYTVPPNFPNADEVARWLSRDHWQPLIGRPLMLLPIDIKFK